MTVAFDDAEAAEDLGEPGLGADSLLGCLVIAARQRGIRLTTGQLVRDHQLREDALTPERLVLIAEAEGLRATIAHLRWADLRRANLRGRAGPHQEGVKSRRAPRLRPGVGT